MRLSYREAFNGEEPPKKLFFNTMKRSKQLFFTALGLLASCSAPRALPAERPHTAIIETADQERTSHAIDDETLSWLRPGEMVRDVVRTKNRAFVLTDSSLLVVSEIPEDDESEYGISIAGLSACGRADMREVLANDLAAWTADHETAYFLTRDNRMLTAVHANELGTLHNYNIPYEIESPRMAIHAGMLFIAPLEGELLVLSFKNNQVSSNNITLPSKIDNLEFSTAGEKLLLFGGMEKIEVRTEGDGAPTVHDIELIRR